MSLILQTVQAWENIYHLAVSLHEMRALALLKSRFLFRAGLLNVTHLGLFYHLTLPTFPDSLQEHGSHIKLEKVGQYLKNCNLRHPAKVSQRNLWSALEKSPILSGANC